MGLACVDGRGARVRLPHGVGDGMGSRLEPSIRGGGHGRADGLDIRRRVGKRRLRELRVPGRLARRSDLVAVGARGTPRPGKHGSPCGSSTSSSSSTPRSCSPTVRRVWLAASWWHSCSSPGDGWRRVMRGIQARRRQEHADDGPSVVRMSRSSVTIAKNARTVASIRGRRPQRRSHPERSERSSVRSQADAPAQVLWTDLVEIPSRSAVSRRVRPPNTRHSTTRPARGSRCASRDSAVSIAMTSSASGPFSCRGSSPGSS